MKPVHWLLPMPVSSKRRDSADWWRAYVADQAVVAAPHEALIRCTSQPSATFDLLAGVLAAVTHDISLELLTVSPGLGSLLIRASFPATDAVPVFRTFRDALLAVSGHVVVLAADPALKRGLDVWGRSPKRSTSCARSNRNSIRTASSIQDGSPVISK